MGLVQKKQNDSGEELTKPEKVKPEKVQKVKKEKGVKSKTGDTPGQKPFKLDGSKLKSGWNKTKTQLKKQDWKNIGGTTFTQIKKANPVKSVGVKLFLIFFAGIMIFVVSLGLLSYAKAKDTIEKNASRSNQETIEQTKQKMDIILERFVDTSTQIFFDPEMQSLLQKMSDKNLSAYDTFVNSSSINKQLSNIAFTNKSMEAIYLVPTDETKSIMGTGSNSSAMGDIRKEGWYDELVQAGGYRWLPTEAKEDGSTPTFRIARSMKNLQGTTQSYVLIIELKLEVLEQQLKSLDLGEGSVLQLIAPDNKVVASTIADRTGKDTDLTFVKELKEKSGSTNTEYTVDGNSTNMLASYSTMDSSDWKLIGMVPTSILVKDAKGILTLTLWMALVDAAIAILIGIWMVRMIARPMGKLKDLMQEGAKGNLKVRTPYSSQDEIGQLSAAFNLMMEQITKLVEQTNRSAQEVLDTASELSSASKKTAVSASEIAVATEEIAGGASSLATEAERGNELTDNISRQMESVVAANEQMGDSARHVEKSSQTGTQHLNQLMTKTQKTEEMIGALVNKVDSLKDSTSSVLKVLDVMQNITKQTNILSLNATIEAARAGTAGRGFMVVANEVRQLAEQSRQSIDMVGDITDKIMTEMNETVDQLSAAYPLFKEQMDAVKDTNVIFASVQQQMGAFVESLSMVTGSIGDLNQSQGTLSEAMSNVSAVAEQSSATSQEVASLSSEQQNISNQLVNLSAKLENVSTELKDTLSRFTV
ncbi:MULTISPECIES: methyl-accepting chemotaxis protein [unclassified Paenibacillus]|uniref:methyl-accepting chemotaxis protein n=1 Tax=unclassified Paenibacillus TaxID=185978 RepID=UPI000B86456D|nr:MULTISPECIES: methyl-accepting chemotaxis protein [unclassified Paenibacillus]QLG38853.1 methyl-accepting chemotaxis protein [Paenibacillus sp. E222]